MELLYQAAEVSYQSFFFDNSGADEPFKLSGHFKLIDNEKVWDEVEENNIAGWFKKYYLKKQLSQYRIIFPIVFDLKPLSFSIYIQL